MKTFGDGIIDGLRIALSVTRARREAAETSARATWPDGLVAYNYSPEMDTARARIEALLNVEFEISETIALRQKP